MTLALTDSLTVNSTASQVITEAYRLIQATDIEEDAAGPSLAARGLVRLNRLFDGWVSQGLNLVTQVITGTTTNGDDEISDLASTAKLAPGMNVSGTGIAASTRILTIDSPTRITLDTNATADGSTISLTFNPIPFQARFEEPLEALLAERLAVLIGEDNIPPMVQRMAAEGWEALRANFMPIPAAVFDPMLVVTTNTRRVSDE